MNEIIAWVLLGLVAVGFGAGIRLSPVDTPLAGQAAAEEEARNLFTQSASGGSFESVAAGEYALMLHGVSTLTVAFSDRPIRDAFDLQTAEYVRSFSTTYAESAPNAELSYVATDDHRRGSVIVTISEPDYDEAAETLTYRVALVEIGGEHGEPLPRVFGAANLFIDDSIGALHISGHVQTSDGESLVGVSVVVKGYMQSTVTDDDGNFSLTIPGATSATVLFELPGFETVTKGVGGSTAGLEVELPEE